MKNKFSISFIINIILVAGITIMFLLHPAAVEQVSTEYTDSLESVSALNIIHQRKSVRHFTDQKVDKKSLETIVRAGMAAPTAMNLQPWDFVIIDDRTVLDQLADSLLYAQMLLQAQAAIVVCGNMEKAAEGEAQEYWIQDCSAASENILLAAESMGLGAVWTAVYPNQSRIDAVKEMLSMPEHIIPLNVIPVGYPTGEDEPKIKWKEENLHWQKW